MLRGSGKKRIDQLLVERGVAPSRTRAQALLMAGVVLVDEQKVEKPGTLVDLGVAIRLLGDPIPYVSRGGVKLAHALAAFHVAVEGRIALDIGISTGGFTDCLLQAGAKRVYGVDVGYGQLDWRLRQDERVRLLERTNARDLTASQLYPPGEPWADLAVIDISFISILKIFPQLSLLLLPPREVIALVKPQFEVWKGGVGKGGVIRDPAIHEQVITTLKEHLEKLGWRVQGETTSPILGGDGNREFFFHIFFTHISV